MNRTLLLILLLIVSAAGLVSLSLNTKPKPRVSVPVSLAQTTLVLSQPVASTSGLLTTNVLINTNGNIANAVQLEISYNSNDLGNFDIKSGIFLKNPIELFKKVDTDNGRVSYALGTGLGQKGTAGQGVVATITFSKLRTSGTTSISFLPKSLVSAEGIAKSVLKSATGLTFDLSTPITPSPSAK